MDIMTIRNLLETRNDAVERAVVRIWERQTTDEQAIRITSKSNGIGFSAFDAGILSSFAEQIQANKWGREPGQILSRKQMEIARKKMKRYARQLAEIASAKAGAA